nr:putative ribonuclease H-like domain-containing protein [Tanacetum cinerariifolium]
QARKEKEPGKDYILLPLWTADPPFPQKPKSSQDVGFKPSNDVGKKVNEVPRQENECNDQEEKDNVNSTNRVNVVSSTVNAASNEVNVVGRKLSIELPDDPNMPELEDISIFKDSNEYVFGFEDHDFPGKVYKVEKALYGLHQALRAWYETLSIYLLENGFQRGNIDKTLFIRKHKGDILLCKKQTVVANSTTKAEYVAASSCCGQTTAKSKTVNEEVQIHALVDGMKVYSNILDKQLNGLPTYKKKYDVSFHTKKVFANMKRISKEFSGKETPLFPTMGDSLVRATTTASSFEVEQASGNIGKTQTKATSNKPSSQETSSGDGHMRQDTMGDTSAHTCTHDEGIEDVGEEEVVEVVTTAKMLIDTVVDAAQVVTTIADVSAAETMVTTAVTITVESTKKNVEVTQVSKRKGVMIQEPEETTTTKTTSSQQSQVHDKARKLQEEIYEQERLVGERARQEEEAKNALIETWEDIQAKVNADYQLAERLQAEEQEKLIDAEKAKLFMEFIEKRRKFFAAKRTVEKRNKPPTKAQQRRLFDKAIKRINNFIDFRTELVKVSTKKDEAETAQEISLKRAGDKLDQERSKKQKVKDDKESAELKQCLEIILDDGDEVTIDATPLFVKTPIVDYKIYKEGKKNYF